MDRARYEWVTGPIVLSRSTKTEFNHGKAAIETKERARFLAGQIRDKALGLVLNWAMGAPENKLQARLLAHRYSDELPRADDWMPTPMVEAGGKIPSGWTFPEPGDPIERGIVA